MTGTAVAKVVTVAILLDQSFFGREINVMTVAYPMAQQLLRVLVPSSGRNKKPITLRAPVIVLLSGSSGSLEFLDMEKFRLHTVQK